MSEPTPETAPAGDPTPPADPTPRAGPAQPADASSPTYKGAPLDAEAGPGLGCFYLQVILLVVLMIVTPLTVVWAFPSWISAALLILTLVVLFFVGMTMVFLLRLVAADRRSQRRPLREGARRTVGQLEQEAGKREDAQGSTEPPPED